MKMNVKQIIIGGGVNVFLLLKTWLRDIAFDLCSFLFIAKIFGIYIIHTILRPINGKRHCGINIWRYILLVLVLMLKYNLH